MIQDSAPDGASDNRYSVQRQRPSALMAAMAIAGVVGYIGLCAYAASGGVRGSDQYWYVSHVAALVEGQGAISNNIYPASLLPRTQPLPRPFVQNNLSVYMALPAAYIAGPFAGWIITNVLCTLLTAALIFLCVRQRAGADPALASAALFLFLPFTFSQACQPLAEATMAVPVAAVVYLYALPGTKPWRWPALTALAGLLLLCRSNFLLLLLALPAAYLWRERPPSSRKIVLAGLMLVAGACFMIFQRVAMEPNFYRSVTQYLMSEIPGKSNNMSPFFNLSPMPFSLSDFLHKALVGVREQFIYKDLERTVLFNLPFNAIFAAGLILGRKKILEEPLYLCAVFFLILHFATVVAFQNLSRYMLVALPAGVALLGSCLADLGALWKRLLPAAMAALIVLGLGADGVLADYSRKKGIQEAALRDRIEQTFKIVPANETVIQEAPQTPIYLLIAYALEPRPVLMVLDNYRPEQYMEMAKIVHAKWLLCLPDSPIPAKMGALPVKVAEIDLGEVYHRRVLYRLDW